MFKKIILTLFIVYLTACSSTEKQPQTIPELNSDVKKLCNDITIASGNTVDSAKAFFGEPSKIITKPAVSPHDASLKNKRVRLTYRDGYISFYEVPKYNNSFLEAAKYTRIFNAQSFANIFGQSRQEIKAKLGTPDKKTKNGIMYYCSNQSNDSINLVYKNNKLTTVVLSNWVD